MKPSGEGESWEPKHQQQEKRWQVDAFLVDWPVAGEYPKFAHMLEEATIKSLRKWGGVNQIYISDDESIAEERESVVTPDILVLKDALRWFSVNDYFQYDEARKVLRPTQKWKDRFMRVTWSN